MIQGLGEGGGVRESSDPDSLTVVLPNNSLQIETEVNLEGSLVTSFQAKGAWEYFEPRNGGGGFLKQTGLFALQNGEPGSKQTTETKGSGQFILIWQGFMTCAAA